MLVPGVIVLEILQYLDLHPLLKCRLVCSGFQYLIDSTASLQYKIELAVAGQQDGSYGDMFTRREMLKMHQERWDGLQWTEILRIPKIIDCWRLSGGVLAQLDSKFEFETLHLKRIPSKSRGVKEKNWMLDLSTLVGGETLTGCFGMDPGQDLLVIIATANRNSRIHLLTLSKGERHPLASEPILMFYHQCYGSHGSEGSCIDIYHDFSINLTSRAILWNWKTGQVLMHIVCHDLTSMVFLNERYTLMAIMKETHPYLLAVDFLAESPELRGLNDLENYFIFRFPDISHSSLVHNITVRSNLQSTWGVDTDPSLPFSMVPQDRLFVVRLQPNDSANLYFAILEASLLCLIKIGLCVNNKSFDWSMWGPEHSRVLLNYPYSHPWPVPSHGTKLAVRRFVPCRGMFVDVYNFNQLQYCNKKQDGDTETPEYANLSKNSQVIEGRPVYILGPTRINARTFRDEVDTRLGYSVTSWFVPGNKYTSTISTICSEDAVIVVDEYNQMIEIYTV